MPRRPVQLDGEGLYETAVKSLARRGRSEAELRRLLGARALVAADIDATLARLRDHGYVDDARLAGNLANHQREVERHGRTRALRELRARGIAPALADAAVRRDFAGSDEDALLRAFARKKRLRRPEDMRQAASLYRKLLLAGFSSAACQRCLRAWKLNPDWLDALESVELPEPDPETPYE